MTAVDLYVGRHRAADQSQRIVPAYPPRHADLATLLREHTQRAADRILANARQAQR